MKLLLFCLAPRYNDTGTQHHAWTAAVDLAQPVMHELHYYDRFKQIACRLDAPTQKEPIEFINTLVAEIRASIFHGYHSEEMDKRIEVLKEMIGKNNLDIIFSDSSQPTLIDTRAVAVYPYTAPGIIALGDFSAECINYPLRAALGTTIDDSQYEEFMTLREYYLNLAQADKKLFAKGQPVSYLHQSNPVPPYEAAPVVFTPISLGVDGQSVPTERCMTMANNIFENITGFSIEQLTGVNPRTALHPGVILDKILHTVLTDNRFFVIDAGTYESYVPRTTESELTERLLNIVQRQTTMSQTSRYLEY
jgi:hypothetical protein